MELTRRRFARTFLTLALAAGVIATMRVAMFGQASAIALTGATVYPAPDRPPIPDGVVIVRQGKIVAVGPKSGVTVANDVTVVDVSGLVLMAGFWNSHVHFSGPQWANAGTAPAAGLAEAFRDMLTRWGFTTVFDTGSPLKNTLALRRRVDSGDVEGPAVFTAGDILYPAGTRNARFEVHTAADARAASRTLLDEGADAIKVYAQAFWDLRLKLPPEAIAEAVAEAHARKKPVLAHPSNRDGLYNAVNAGVDVLVHTTPQIGPWGPELVARMKASNIALIPTLKLWRFELLKEKVPEAGIVAFQRRGVEQLREYSSAGGTILFGTDVGYMTDFSTLEEFQQMAQAGMGFREILASLTTVPAARQGLGASSGRVEAGFDADLVLLRGDPVRNADAFADVAYTVKRGRIIYRR